MFRLKKRRTRRSRLRPRFIFIDIYCDMNNNTESLWFLLNDCGCLHQTLEPTSKQFDDDMNYLRPEMGPQACMVLFVVDHAS